MFQLASLYIDDAQYYQPPFMIAQFLSRPLRNGSKLMYFSAKIMGSKNACALEFACILGHNIKCLVIIIISVYGKK